ncbi:MAG: N-acetylneuraminate synthase [Pseudomonadota bacterium]|jgi:N,N'-diacetyllegionaminate synthase
MGESVFVIAEAGVNHNGDPEMARRLIDVAAEAGADAVKFQTFSADRLVTRVAGKAAYQKQSTDAAESQHAMLKRLELSDALHRELIDRCRARGIEFLSTGFDIESIDLLAGLGMKRFKIPSGEITNLPYLRHVGRLGREVILSTGMSTLDDVAAALTALVASGTPRDAVTVLHCTTEYPAPFRDVNLRAMNQMGDRLGVKVGYSDHTPGIEVAIAAVARGARVIEKHFTLDRALPGPDHAASLEPDELSAMVRAIRHVELALGDSEKRVADSESGNQAVVRKSIVARTAIRKGELFSESNLTTKRPGSGLSPMHWDDVLGRSAPRDFAADELIDL